MQHLAVGMLLTPLPGPGPGLRSAQGGLVGQTFLVLLGPSCHEGPATRPRLIQPPCHCLHEVGGRQRGGVDEWGPWSSTRSILAGIYSVLGPVPCLLVKNQLLLAAVACGARKVTT